MTQSYYDDGYVTPSDVKNFAYCPVIPWIEAVFAVREPSSHSMEAAKSLLGAEEKRRIAEGLGLPRPIRIEVPLVSRRLRMRGVADVIAGERRLTVMETKAFDRRPSSLAHFRAQLLAYALLASDALGPVREAVLYTPSRVVRIPISDRHLEAAESMVVELRRALESEEPPRTSQPRAKCRYCWHRRWCPHA